MSSRDIFPHIHFSVKTKWGNSVLFLSNWEIKTKNFFYFVVFLFF
ncbi:hypothetical protein LEP1GSC162_3605 [Leptospira santarosai str. CBC1531]|nr:hypothetical protein LEP1GSC162_3605 [Leptospira santarosai str. CBC1531]